MKRFQFPLDRVRVWREEQVELERAKLQELCGQLSALAQEKTRVENERARSVRNILEQPAVEAQDLQALDAFRVYVRTRIGQIEKRQRELAARIDEQRGRVMEARRRAELLERLKARKLEAWQALADREEETLAGEMYLAKFGAKWRR